MTDEEFNSRVDALETLIGQARAEAKHLLGVAITRRQGAIEDHKTEWRYVGNKLERIDKALLKGLQAAQAID